MKEKHWSFPTKMCLKYDFYQQLKSADWALNMVSFWWFNADVARLSDSTIKRCSICIIAEDDKKRLALKCTNV